MKTWYDILDEVKEVKGKQKQQILEENKDDHILKDVLRFVYDTNVVTGISKKKLNKKVDTHSWEKKISVNSRIQSLMCYLRQNNTGKDKDISYCKSILQQANHDEKEWLEKVITKDMKIGITKTTINKVFPKLIPEFKPMRLTKYSSELFPKENIVMPKLDGNYCCVYSNGEKVKYFARSGKEYQGLNHIDEYFIDKPGVYFGEIIIPNHFDEHTKDFQKSNAILNSKGDKSQLGIVLFDMYMEDVTFDERILTLYDKFGNIDFWKPNREEYEYIDYVYTMPILNFESHLDFYYDYNENELMNEFHKYKEQGYEGLVIYDRNNIWQPKRVKDILKLKGVNSCDLKVLDIFEHKNGNKLGGVIVDYKGGKLKVGSGFNDYDRDRYWNNPEDILDKIVEVEYFTTSKNQEGIESLRHPVFKRVRNDKEEVSYD